MNEENNSGVSPLEDIDYVPPEKKNDGPTGVSAPVLDDIDYVAPTARKGAPTGVSAPVLDDDNYVAPTQRKGAPTGVTAPVLDDAPQDFSQSSAPKPNVLSDEDIIAGLTPELKEKFDALPDAQKQQVLNMRRTQLGAVAPVQESAPITAPILDEPDAYTPPPMKEAPKPQEPVTAPVLDEEPELPEYKPNYVDEDLERIKREAKKKAVSSQLVSNQKDEKESLRMMMALKEERRAELAQKGFIVTIAAALVGVAAAVLFFLLFTGAFGTDYKEGLGGLNKTIKEFTPYIAGVAGICSLTLITGVNAFKSLTSFVFVLFGLIQLFPGLPMVPQHKNGGTAALLCAGALIMTVALIIMLSTSESIGAYFSRNNKSRHYND